MAMRKLTGYGPSIVVLGTAALVLLAGPAIVRHLTYVQTRTRIVHARQALDDNDVLQRINQAYRDIATVVEPSVVHISAQQVMNDVRRGPRMTLSTGSGWIYDEDGHVVTNHHVVQGAQRIDVQLYDGRLRDARIVGADPTTDVAVIKIEADGLHPAMVSEGQEPLRQGDQVFAFGSPFDFRFSMSSGVVSGLGRSVGVIRDSARRAGYENFIQVDAAINPGNSGGPLTDARGEVIGMNCAIATNRTPANALDEGQFAGIGLAIPIMMIRPVVDQIIEKGFVVKGFLGVSIANRDTSLAEEFRALGCEYDGVVVLKIEEDNPAAAAGLQPQDVILLAAGRRTVAIDSLLDATSELASGQSAKLVVWRYDEDDKIGRMVDLEVPPTVAEGWRGLTLAQMNEKVTSKFAQLDVPAGVLVTRVTEGGPAEAVGLKRDDVITSVNDHAVTTTQQLQSVISSIQPGEQARLSVWRFDPERQLGAQKSFEVPLARLNELQLTGILPADQDRQAIPEVGIARMASSTRERADEAGVEFQQGVIIQEIVPDTELAEIAQPGSIIVDVRGHDVRDVEEFIAELRAGNLDFGVPIGIINPDGKRVEMTLGLQ